MTLIGSLDLQCQNEQTGRSKSSMILMQETLLRTSLYDSLIALYTENYSYLKKDRKTCTQCLREKCHLLSLKNRRRFLRFQLVFKIVKRHNCPEHLENYIATRASLRLRSLRDDSLLNIPTARSSMGQKTFQYSAAKDWNRPPKELRDITNCKSFKTELFKYLFNADKASHQCSVVN